jgi:methylated-DNA-[protein]-cysteine S-methyltransferase
MSTGVPTCREVEPDLVALAAAEASPAAIRRVESHVAICGDCRAELGQYRALERMVSGLRGIAAPGPGPTLARAELEGRLADLRSRLVRYGVFDSTLGPILIGSTEHGVSVVEYVSSRSSAGAKLARGGADAVEDRSRTEGLYRELAEYLEGRRHRLDWPLDFGLVRGDFQRRVLDATARLPYGAVASYAGIAREIGAPRASRAVAQALRHNPVAIVVPCHRVIGSDGDLTGYAGDKVALKQRLLTIEGIRTAGGRKGYHVERDAVYYRRLDDSEYCLPTCGSIGAEPLGEFTLYASRARAEAVGLAPCTSCRPDLHALPA